MQIPSEILELFGLLSSDEYPSNEEIETACANLTREKLVGLVAYLFQKATTDFLTGILNFRGLATMAQRFIARCKFEDKPVAVVAFDLDKFKRANDKKGHLIGDKILWQVAAALKESTRPGDILSRKGGDEFILVVSYSTADIYELVEKIRERVFLYTRRYYDDGISISAGVATTAYSGYEWERLCADAFDALHNVKEAGGNQTLFAAAV
jgi:diguanylate cyclase (GGDEF)-like protein